MRRRVLLGDVEARFDQNIAEYRDRIAKLVMPSAAALPRLEQAGARFDLIYIDGSHRLMDEYRDSTLCWPLLKIRWNSDLGRLRMDQAGARIGPTKTRDQSLSAPARERAP
jgi:hypothetical protein